MDEQFAYGQPHEAAAIAETLLATEPIEKETWWLEDLFHSDHIKWANDAIFLKDEEGSLVAMAIISTMPPPHILSCYTIPKYRRKGYGYKVLKRCIERILETWPDESPSPTIHIEVVSKETERNIKRLPPDLERWLEVGYSWREEDRGEERLPTGTELSE